MWEIILRMSGAVLLYMLITAGLWHFRRNKAPLGTGLKILIGLVFGACSVASSHFGVNYYTMILNVRDIGPLSAGLFFSPLSGIIAGLIGGIERYLAGTLWELAPFTTMACSVSTCLAGILAALMNRFVFNGRRPSVPHAFMIGMLVEVFHMYAVLLFRQDIISIAYSVVRTAALPMIAFTAAGLSLCSAVIRKLSGEPFRFSLHLPKSKAPLSIQFQRALLTVIAAVFLFNFAMDWHLNTRAVRNEAENDFSIQLYNISQAWEKTRNTEDFRQALCTDFIANYSYTLAENGEASLYIIGLAPEPLNTEDTALLLAQPENELFTVPLSAWMNMQLLGMRRELAPGLSLYVLRLVDAVYMNRDNQMIEGTLSDILLFSLLYILLVFLVDRLVLRNLKHVNISLGGITAGNLEEKVSVRSSPEFSELSDDINKTVDALRGYIHAAEKKMEDELKLAAAIQDSALPKNFAFPSGHIELHALMIPARKVGGDFYDFFSLGPGRLCLVIADVSGKGVPASLFMMRAKTSIKYYARSGNSPKELLTNVNSTLCEDNDADMFVTVWLGILELDSGLLRCANAGHEYPAVMRAGGDYELMKDKHGMMLGSLENIPVREYEVRLRPGDRFFVYTDGVPEAMNEKTEQYTTARMIDRLNGLKNLGQKQLLEGMLQDVRNFAGTAEQFDDITMLGFTYKDLAPSIPAENEGTSPAEP